MQHDDAAQARRGASGGLSSVGSMSGLSPRSLNSQLLGKPQPSAPPEDPDTVLLTPVPTQAMEEYVELAMQPVPEGPAAPCSATGLAAELARLDIAPPRQAMKRSNSIVF